jgi:hypothetical protein
MNSKTNVGLIVFFIALGALVTACVALWIGGPVYGEKYAVYAAGFYALYGAGYAILSCRKDSISEKPDEERV